MARDIEDTDDDGFLSRPVELKAWHILTALGVGGLVLYIALSKKEEPKPAPASAGPPPQPPQQLPPTGTNGMNGLASMGYAHLGEQTEPLYDGHPMVDDVRQYVQKGWTVFKIPTGHENVMRNRERFEVNQIYAAPPGAPIPRGAEKVT